ncbi:MAG: acyl-CoA dehydrogenase family protein [Acidobacteriota bacterium]
MDPILTASEAALREKARGAAREFVLPLAADIDTSLQFPPHALRALADQGLLGDCLPAEYGGSGNGLLELAVVVEEVAAASASVAAVLVSHMGLVALTLARYGSEEQKRELLPDLTSGARLATLAVDGGGSLLRGPGVGVVVADDDGAARLEGELSSVTGATAADLFLVPAFLKADARHSADAAVEQELFLVTADSPGLRVDDEQPKLGLNGSGTASVTLDAVEVTAGDRLPTETSSASVLAEALDVGRLAIAALSVGLAQAALDAALEVARESADGLSKSQAVQWMLADSATETEAARLLTWYAASRSSGVEFSEAAAMARLLAADSAVASSRRAVQVFGGRGGLRSTGVERLYRDSKVMEILLGPNESQRLIVARHLLPDLVEGPGEREPWTGN